MLSLLLKSARMIGLWLTLALVGSGTVLGANPCRLMIDREASDRQRREFQQAASDIACIFGSACAVKKVGVHTENNAVFEVKQWDPNRQDTAWIDYLKVEASFVEFVANETIYSVFAHELSHVYFHHFLSERSPQLFVEQGDLPKNREIVNRAFDELVADLAPVLANQDAAFVVDGIMQSFGDSLNDNQLRSLGFRDFANGHKMDEKFAREVRKVTGSNFPYALLAPARAEIFRVAKEGGFRTSQAVMRAVLDSSLAFLARPEGPIDPVELNRQFVAEFKQRMRSAVSAAQVVPISPPQAVIQTVRQTLTPSHLNMFVQISAWPAGGGATAAPSGSAIGVASDGHQIPTSKANLKFSSLSEVDRGALEDILLDPEFATQQGVAVSERVIDKIIYVSQETADWMKPGGSPPDSWSTLGLVLRDRNDPTAVVGYVGLTRSRVTHEEAEIGYFVAPQYRGQGIGGQMVRDFIALMDKGVDLDVLTARVLPQNIGSVKILTSSGFRKVGTSGKFDLYEYSGNQ